VPIYPRHRLQTGMLLLLWFNRARIVLLVAGIVLLFYLSLHCYCPM
jgi:hypothetical protein